MHTHMHRQTHTLAHLHNHTFLHANLNPSCYKLGTVCFCAIKLWILRKIWPKSHHKMTQIENWKIRRGFLQKISPPPLPPLPIFSFFPPLWFSGSSPNISLLSRLSRSYSCVPSSLFASFLLYCLSAFRIRMEEAKRVKVTHCGPYKQMELCLL